MSNVDASVANALKELVEDSTKVRELEAEVAMFKQEAKLQSEWQPISTAPKTRTILLVKIAGIEDNPTFNISGCPPYVWWACKGHWSDRWGNWNDGIEPSGLAGPTHWMELPAPPTEPEQ